MLSDSKREIKQAADSVLSEFLTEIRKAALEGPILYQNGIIKNLIVMNKACYLC